jgi:transposase-like protein
MDGFTMADKTVWYTAEFKRQMVALARGGRSAVSLAKEFGPSAWTIGHGSSRRGSMKAKAMAG